MRLTVLPDTGGPTLVARPWPATAAHSNGPVPGKEGREAPPRRTGQLRRRAAVAVAAMVLGWAGMVFLAGVLHVPVAERHIALFVHVVSVVVGFGAVLSVDLYGLQWSLKRRQLGEVLNHAASLEPLIWVGLAGLTLSGLFLEPELSKPRTWVKMVLVLAVTLNGLNARQLTHQAKKFGSALHPGAVPASLLRRVAAASAVSQTGWWGAVVIGFLTTVGRHGG